MENITSLNVNGKKLRVDVGETPIVGLAPAVSNAIFDATRVRIRSLPLASEGIISHG